MGRQATKYFSRTISQSEIAFLCSADARHRSYLRDAERFTYISSKIVVTPAGRLERRPTKKKVRFDASDLLDATRQRS